MAQSLTILEAETDGNFIKYTDKKETKFPHTLGNPEGQKGVVKKSYMTNGLLLYVFFFFIGVNDN